jgi:hypothetical protein
MNKYLFLILSLLLASCASVKEADRSLRSKSARQLIKKVNEHDQDYDWFTAKLSGKASLSNQEAAVAANVRLKKDSLIWISVTALMGIEVVRVQITPDSLKLINRLTDSYWKGAWEEAKNRFAVPLDFQALQNTILGEGMLDEDAKYKSGIEGKHYRLTQKGMKEGYFSCWLDRSFFPVRYEWSDDGERTVQLRYTAFEAHGKHWAPTGLSLLAGEEEQSLSLSFKYSKVKINSPKKTNFNIPDSYVFMD